MRSIQLSRCSPVADACWIGFERRAGHLCAGRLRDTGRLDDTDLTGDGGLRGVRDITDDPGIPGIRRH